jgi:hypothetical protein
MRLKTLHLTNSWHPASGGIGTFYRALLESANQRGQRVTLVVPGAGESVEAFSLIRIRGFLHR